MCCSSLCNSAARHARWQVAQPIRCLSWHLARGTFSSSISEGMRTLAQRCTDGGSSGRDRGGEAGPRASYPARKPHTTGHAWDKRHTFFMMRSLHVESCPSGLLVRTLARLGEARAGGSASPCAPPPAAGVSVAHRHHLPLHTLRHPRRLQPHAVHPGHLLRLTASRHAGGVARRAAAGRAWLTALSAASVAGRRSLPGRKW
jgi:hypothetical protein